MGTDVLTVSNLLVDVSLMDVACSVVWLFYCVYMSGDSVLDSVSLIFMMVQIILIRLARLDLSSCVARLARVLLNMVFAVVVSSS